MTSSTSRPSGRPQPRSVAVTSPADILSYVPHALGFMPSHSLVVLTTAGRRLGATLRVDLPPDGADPLAFAEGVLSFLDGDTDADGTLLIVYSGEEWRRFAPAPHQAPVLALEAVLELAGLPVRGGWFVAPAGWRDYFCRDDDCCPWPGQSLDTVTSSALNAELVFGGSAFDASAPAAVVRSAPAVAVGGRTAEAERHAVEDAQAHVAACCAGRWTSPRQFRATSAAWDAVLALQDDFDTRADPEVAGFLLASIESRAVRDFLLVSACLGSATALGGAAASGLLDGDGSGGNPPPTLPAVRGSRSAGKVLRSVREEARAASAPQTPPDAAGEGLSPEPVSGADSALVYADLLAGRFTGEIAWHRVDAMTGVLARLAAVSDGESRAAALTMSAWFEYARGRGSRAAVFLDAAEQAVPGYRLARLLSELLRRGGLPAWARRRSTAWTADAAKAPPGAAGGALQGR
jgi:hypothetical protein